MATTTPLTFAPELTDALRAEGKNMKAPQYETLNHLTTSEGKSFPGPLQEADIEANSKPFDPASLQAKYKAERDKRLTANPAGLDQYISIDKDDPLFRRYLDDPYIQEPIRRGPIQQESEVLIIGGGFGGQLVAARLIEQGITDLSIVEKGGDFGGTWQVPAAILSY